MLRCCVLEPCGPLAVTTWPAASATQLMQPLLSSPRCPAAVGRVFTSGEPEMSNHVQRYDQHVYLRAAEAQVRNRGGWVTAGWHSGWDARWPVCTAARAGAQPHACRCTNPTRPARGALTAQRTPRCRPRAALPRALHALHAAVRQRGA